MPRDRWQDVRDEQPSPQPSYGGRSDSSNYQPSNYQPSSSNYQQQPARQQQYGGAYTQSSNNYTRAQPQQYGRTEDIEMGQRRGGGLDNFLQQAEEIQQHIAEIGKNTADIQGLHQRALVETNQQQLQSLTRIIDSTTDRNNDLIQSTRAQIKGLSNIRAANNGEARVRTTQQKALAKKLMEAAQQYQQVQQQAKSAYRNQMTRQYAIARPNASREEIEEAIDSGSGQIFQQEIMTSRVGEQRRALEAVRTRHDELLRIEQSITELFELFQEMQALLEQQGETINAIETHVEETNAAVEDGSKQMTKAVASAKSARKTKRWILCIVITIIIIIAAGLAIYFLVPGLRPGGGGGNNNNNSSQQQQSQAPTNAAVPTVSTTVVAGAQLSPTTTVAAATPARSTVTSRVAAASPSATVR
ncbi:Plasma membrane t-SNARE, secretory vesicle fusion [Rhizophlyctis rosea]|nr:Plasma membrane t-SNARE, secretory vesicle fusion [Rhizophlyctis rosea]